MDSKNGRNRHSSFAEQNGSDSQPDAVRVLVVGSEDVTAGLADVAAANVVGRASAEELVPAIDMLEPQVLLLSSAAAALAARMSSCPAAVVVTKATESDRPVSPAVAPGLLEIALRLAIACP